MQRAVEDAGLALSDVDGLSIYSGERSEPTSLAQTLGIGDLRYISLYPGGGNSACAVVHHAAMAVASGSAEVVVCYRSICQGQFGRFGRARVGAGTRARTGGEHRRWAAGVHDADRPDVGRPELRARGAPAHVRVRHDDAALRRRLGRGVRARERNPRAVMYGRPLTMEDHENARG